MVNSIIWKNMISGVAINHVSSTDMIEILAKRQSKPALSPNWAKIENLQRGQCVQIILVSNIEGGYSEVFLKLNKEKSF